MNKTEFLGQLATALGKLPKHEKAQSLAFYAEIIDDRIEDGMSEEQAVESLGDVSVIAAQIIAETPPVPKAIAKANTGSRTLNIVLLAVFSPFWVPLALTAIAVAFAIWISLWALIVSLWAVVVSLFAGGIMSLISSLYCLFTGFPATAVLAIGMGLICISLALFCTFGVIAATKWLYGLTKSFGRKIRSLFVKQEVTNEAQN